jgi:SpoVK/Ycf46/Vps4 family AAA+-type ATPase
MAQIDERERQRAANLWEAFARKIPPMAKSARLLHEPAVDLPSIGGLAEAKEEILTYACAATEPEVYGRWGTAPPSGILLIGPEASGKTLLAEALAVRTGTPFLRIDVPLLVLSTLHAGGNAGAIVVGWEELLRDLPRTTILFRELDLRQIQMIVSSRAAMPIGPVMDFVVELVDRAVAAEPMLVVGSASHPETISPVFLEPGRFERIVYVNPNVPDDVVAALAIHAAAAEKRAGRPLFEKVEWAEAVKRDERASIGDWVQLLHAILRRKARCDAADEKPGLVTTADLIDEVERFRRTATRLPVRTGTYL